MSKTNTAARLYPAIGLLVAFVLAASPAHAQYRPRPMSDPATGESYHIEASAGFWSPGAAIFISSESLGIVGSEIDFKKDLGLEDSRFPELHLVLRPSRGVKFRFQYIPITYETSTVLKRTIIFNGQSYPVGYPVNGSLVWKAYRFGFEYDFIARDTWFVGFILDGKYTDVHATLASPLDVERTRARAPIPAIGGIARFYPVSNVSITGELSGFTLRALPRSIRQDDTGHYTDFDLYGTLNFTNNIGVQLGYRSFDIGYRVDTDSGSLTLKGLYLAVVARY
jgi:hypothetical protein